jgi:hypothetical protein
MVSDDLPSAEIKNLLPDRWISSNGTNTNPRRTFVPGLALPVVSPLSFRDRTADPRMRRDDTLCSGRQSN